MSGRTQFWLGSVMLALAMGLLVGSFLYPRTTLAQDGVGGEGRTGRYALVPGVRGTTQQSETLYVVDDMNEVLFVFEYSSRSKEIEPRALYDLQQAASGLIKKRAERDRKKLK
jgi:hypothetical protein